MSMVAVGTDHIVVRSKSGKCTDCNCLFADIQMEKSGNFCEGVHLGRFFFKPADQQHLAIQRVEICSVHACHYAWMLRVDSTPICEIRGRPWLSHQLCRLPARTLPSMPPSFYLSISLPKKAV